MASAAAAADQPSVSFAHMDHARQPQPSTLLVPPTLSADKQQAASHGSSSKAGGGASASEQFSATNNASTIPHMPRRKPAKRSARHFVEEPLYMLPSHFVLLHESTGELLRGLTNLSSAVENDPLYFDQLLGAAVNVKHAFDLGRIDVINGTIRPRNTSLCHECITTVSSVWRSGPEGARTLCNACGLRYYKQNQRRALEAKRRESRDTVDAASSLASLRVINVDMAKKLMAASKGKNAPASYPNGVSPDSSASSLSNSKASVFMPQSYCGDDDDPNEQLDDDDDDDDENDDDGDGGRQAEWAPYDGAVEHIPIPVPADNSRHTYVHNHSSPELTRPSIANLCDMHVPEHQEQQKLQQTQTIDHKYQTAENPFTPSIKNILVAAPSSAPSQSARTKDTSINTSNMLHSYYSHVDNTSYYYHHCLPNTQQQ
ncbi:hypothetical protein GGI25_000107 [Coemansia spiralis]|uniref:GATA-type domain-containing protein n=1 Tax=Coemansia spiralis TaxID=417178 RepID=A0A9W8GF19_9FUNG|nr:hypothetical protein GGI25_000107 [Coemansia spiralis]